MQAQLIHLAPMRGETSRWLIIMPPTGSKPYNALHFIKTIQQAALQTEAASANLANPPNGTGPKIDWPAPGFMQAIYPSAESEEEFVNFLITTRKSEEAIPHIHEQYGLTPILAKPGDKAHWLVLGPPGTWDRHNRMKLARDILDIMRATEGEEVCPPLHMLPAEGIKQVAPGIIQHLAQSRKNENEWFTFTILEMAQQTNQT